LVTLHSCDVDAPGVMPWNDGHSKFLKLASSYPLVLVGGATPFPEQPPLSYEEEPPPIMVVPLGAPPPPRKNFISEFTTTWQLGDGKFPNTNLFAPGMNQLGSHLFDCMTKRLDLNRPLPDYPPVDPVTGRIPRIALPQFGVAESARQQFAWDIFRVLL